MLGPQGLGPRVSPLLPPACINVKYDTDPTVNITPIKKCKRLNAGYDALGNTGYGAPKVSPSCLCVVPLSVGFAGCNVDVAGAVDSCTAANCGRTSAETSGLTAAAGLNERKLWVTPTKNLLNGLASVNSPGYGASKD